MLFCCCGPEIFVFAAEMYVKEVSGGLCDSKATPIIVKETPGTAFVDGRNGIGSVRVCVLVDELWGVMET